MAPIDGEMAKDGSGLFMTLMDEGYINLHVRGGHILPLQKPNVTTFLSRQQDMGLFVAPDESGAAKGLLFWDDGISYETQEHKTYLLVDLTLKKNKDKAILYSNITIGNFPEAHNAFLGYLTFCNQVEPSKVLINGITVPSKKLSYDADLSVLRIVGIHVKIAEEFELILLFK